MVRAHSEVLGPSLPRLRPSLFLAARSLPSDGDFQPEASQVPFAVLSSLLQEGVQEVTVLLKSLLPYYFFFFFLMSAFL